MEQTARVKVINQHTSNTRLLCLPTVGAPLHPSVPPRRLGSPYYSSNGEETAVQHKHSRQFELAAWRLQRKKKVGEQMSLVVVCRGGFLLYQIGLIRIKCLKAFHTPADLNRFLLAWCADQTNPYWCKLEQRCPHHTNNNNKNMFDVFMNVLDQSAPAEVRQTPPLGVFPATVQSDVNFCSYFYFEVRVRGRETSSQDLPASFPCKPPPLPPSPPLKSQLVADTAAEPRPIKRPEFYLFCFKGGRQRGLKVFFKMALKSCGGGGGAGRRNKKEGGT